MSLVNPLFSWEGETKNKHSMGGICIDILEHIAARGGGGSFKREKIYNSEEHVPIESFVTTLIHWTFFSDDANKVGICWLCRSGQLHVTPSSR